MIFVQIKREKIDYTILFECYFNVKLDYNITFDSSHSIKPISYKMYSSHFSSRKGFIPLTIHLNANNK